MFTNDNNIGYTPYPRRQEPDYSKMTLRQELETRFADMEQQKKTQQCIAPHKSSFSTPSNFPFCYEIFDGKNLKLYRNNIKEYDLEAMSGQPKYQCKKYQNIPNKGPIPEGVYHIYQNQRQNIDIPRAIAGFIPFINKGWRGSIPSWGIRRIPLVPDKTTNTYGRGGFFSHGGWSKGSAGCIDTPFHTDKISDFLDKCQYDVPVYVKYPNECW